MSYTPSSAQIATAVRERFESQSTQVGVYWVRVDGNREEYANELRCALSDSAVVVLPVRQAGFRDPNTILLDFVSVLNGQREACLAALSNCDSDRHAIILLARNSLDTPQAPSPVQLPDWYPQFGSSSLFVVLEDLTSADVAALNCSQARIDEVAAALYSLEGELIRRLADVHQRQHNAPNALSAFWAKDGDGDFPSLLKAFASSHAGVRNPTSYRPSRRDSGVLMGRLWGLVSARSAEESKSSKALAVALGLPDYGTQPRESLTAVLSRTTQRLDPSTRTGRNLLATVYAACQMVTAAAHADDYGRYAPQLLVGFSLDLRLTLADLTRYLEGLTG